VELRRFSPRGTAPCVKAGYHDAKTAIEEKTEEPLCVNCEHSRKDSRWPKKCDHCDYKFTENDNWGVWRRRIYIRTDTKERLTLQNAPVGAMWYWDGYSCKGEDGHCLMVKTPGGDWIIDSRASNCTMKEDNIHRCWVRHGTPPNVTVSKNGNTCRAGAGSILVGSYHGFLRNGYLED